MLGRKGRGSAHMGQVEGDGLAVWAHMGQERGGLWAHMGQRVGTEERWAHSLLTGEAVEQPWEGGCLELP